MGFIMLSDIFFAFYLLLHELSLGFQRRDRRFYCKSLAEFISGRAKLAASRRRVLVRQRLRIQHHHLQIFTHICLYNEQTLEENWLRIFTNFGDTLGQLSGILI